MHINNNAQKLAVENILNQIGEIYTKIGDEVILYPLKIVSGIVDFTENGEFPLRYNIDNFTSNLGVITSNEPIVCYWEGAYKSYVPTLILGANYQLKHMSAEEGRKIKTWIMQYSTDLVNSEQIINDNAYTTIALNRNIRSFCTDWVPTDNEMRNYLYLYLDKKAKSPQFLKMTSKEPRYLPGGKLAGCELAFMNLNQEYSQSGKDVLNFVKMVHPGGNYPFPKEVITENGTEVELDTNRLNTRGVNDIQLQFYNSYWLNSITVFGAPKSNWVIEAPRRLLLCNPHPAISSALDIDGSSLNNYYAVFGARTMYQSFWGTWKEKVQSFYDYTAKKTYMGGWKLGTSETWQNVMDTNPIVNEAHTYNMWNNWTFHPTDEKTFITTETPYTDTSITFDTETAYRPEDFLNHNSFIYGSMDTLPMEFSESTRYTIGDFGGLGKIIQGFIQIFTIGFNPGWTTNNTWVASKPINFLIPTSTFNFGRLMTSSEGAVGSEPIPFDIVNPDFSAGGNKTCVCGYRYQLTRYFQSPSQAIEDATVEGKGKNGIWDTKYLGQTQWEDGSWIFDNHSMLKWKSDCKAISPLEREEEYEVYLASYKGIGLTTCRMTFYNYINHDPANVESVWESRQLTNAKFKNDLTLWTNTYRLNFSEEANNEGVIDYPTNVVPPSPQAQSIRVTDFEGVYNKDDNMARTYTPFVLDNYSLSEGINIEYTNCRGYAERAPKTYYWNCVYKLPQQFKTIKSYDLTQKIGVGKLNQYQNFSFRFSSIASKNYDYNKDITVNISDLVDNQWTKILIATPNQLINYANADAYPRNYAKFDTGNLDKIYNCFGYINNNNGSIFAPVATDIVLWMKLNKTTQILQVGFDNPEGEISFTPISSLDVTQQITYQQHQTFQVVQNINETDINGDLIVAFPTFKWKAESDFGIKIDNVSAENAPSIRITKEQLESTTTINNALITSASAGMSERYDFKISSINISKTGTQYTLVYNWSIDAQGTRHLKTGTLNFTMKSYDSSNYVYPTAIRNIYISPDATAPLGKQYTDKTFFRGYRIQDFFINPTT